MRVRTQTPKLTNETDASLVEAARAGSSAAFEELYRRHAHAAWRVAQAVAHNSHDAADAVSDAFTRVFAALPAGRLEEAGQFRGYLLATTRNAAIDAIRKSGRTRPTDTIADLATPTTSTDAVLTSEDSRIVAEAFRDLPERWRSVLWLTEVEGMPTREVGARLGLSPNGVAQLAVRARAGLRERFLQAHLRADVERQCRYTVDRLGAYVAGKLAPRDLAKVDQHLAGCAPCRERKEHLEDVGGRLRAIVLPLPLLLGPQVLSHFTSANIAATTAAGVGGSSVSWTSSLATKAQKPLMAATSGIFALGVISATVLGGPDAPLRGPRMPPAAIAGGADGTDAAPEVPGPTGSVRFANAAFEIPLDADFSDFETEAAAAPSVPESSRTVAEDETAGTSPPPAPAASDAEPEPLAQAAITVALGPLGAGITLGAGDDSCTGATIYDEVELGCTPEEPATLDDGTNDLEVSASLDGSELGELDDTEVTVGLP